MSSDVWWPAFCGNETQREAFWSVTLTWSASQPDLTHCFQATVLTWTPCAWLLACSALYLPYTGRTKPDLGARGLSRLGIVQAVGICALIVLSILELTNLLVTREDGSIYPVDYTAIAVNLLTYVLLLVFHVVCRQRGFYNTGVEFIFWLITLAFAALTFRSQILQLGDTPAYLFVLYTVRFALVLAQFICTFIADSGRVHCVSAQVHYDPVSDESEQAPLLRENRASLSREREEGKGDEEEQKLTNPMLACSFPSYITFFWLIPLVKLGYVGDIELRDIWKLRKNQRAQQEIANFSRHWRNCVANSDLVDFSTRGIDNVTVGSSNASSEHSESESSESGSVGDNGENNSGDVDAPKNKGWRMAWVLTKVMMKSFGGYYFNALPLIFAYYGILLLNPFLLREVIAFVDGSLSGSAAAPWVGYGLAAAMFAVSVSGSLIFHNHLVITCATGMRAGTALTAAIYRKALRLSARARRQTTVGEICNLMSIDVQKVEQTFLFFFYIWPVPLMLCMTLYFLWTLLGPSCLAGLVYLFGILPAGSQLITRKMISLQGENMKLKDERIKLVNQVLAGVKVIKFYAWEPFFENRIMGIRRQETDNLRKFWIYIAFANVLLICTPFVVAVLCFGTFILSDPSHVLTPQVAFVSLSFLNLMSLPLNVVPFVIMNCSQCYVSLKRLARFLLEDEVPPSDTRQTPVTRGTDMALSIQDASFTWGEHGRADLRRICLDAERGSLVAVVGEVGSGKSSLLSAILGDMLKISGTLSVQGTLAYVPQQAWIQNLSLRDNILFGKPLSERRYNDVIERCALQPDLAVLPAGDSTEIGEKGINLSGGQKQRVSLARAVYSDADIYLLDDPLSAVDAHVGKHIFERVVGPQGALQKKTRVLVTNQLQYARHADHVVVLARGRVAEAGAFNELVTRGGRLAELISAYVSEINEGEQEGSDEEVKVEIRALQRAISTTSSHSHDSVSKTTTPPVAGQLSRPRARRQHSRRSTQLSESEAGAPPGEKREKQKAGLVEEESVEKGTIKWPVLRAYLHSLTPSCLLVAAVGLVGFVASQAFTNIWLSAWSNDAVLEAAAGNDTDDVITPAAVRLGVYAALGVGQVVTTAVFNLALAVGSVKAARLLHDVLLGNVLKCPMAFFDTTPLGRILNRFSRDIENLDRYVPEFLLDLLLFGAPLMATFTVIFYSVPIFAAVFVPLVFVFLFFQRIYAHCARQLKRLDAIHESPIFNFFSETLSGVASIRAYGHERRFINNSDRLINRSQSVWFTVFMSYRWINLAGELIAAFVVLFVVVFVVYQRESLSPGLAGLAVTYCLQVTIDMTLVLRTLSELETRLVSVERIKEYTEQQTEAPWRVAGATPVADWPAEGAVSFRDYSTRYRPGLDLVLNKLTLHIKPKEKVGVVGRTGAGKSSLALSLFRLLEAAEGAVVVDGIDIAQCGLHDVRGRLAIIPQDPVLFSGSVRFNLDPAGSNSDSALWDCLQHAHLKSFVTSLPGGLDYECGEDGENLSVGQRQLVCLARALLRHSRILVLDEATASVDMETDSLIQTTIQEEFRDCTVITVAHRLNTVIDYDRILVMEAGRAVEFDTPASLLQNRDSKFYAMAKDAGLVS